MPTNAATLSCRSATVCRLRYGGSAKIMAIGKLNVVHPPLTDLSREDSNHDVDVEARSEGSARTGRNGPQTHGRRLQATIAVGGHIRRHGESAAAHRFPLHDADF